MAFMSSRKVADGTVVWRPHTPQWRESAQRGSIEQAGEREAVGPPGPYRQIELSPDGRRLAVERYREAGPGLELVDLASATFTRVELPSSTVNFSDPSLVTGRHPRRGGDGRGAAADADDIVNVDRRGANVETISTGRDPRNAANGRRTGPPMASTSSMSLTDESRTGLWSAPPVAGGPPVRLTPEGATADQGQLSPDDRWVAYTSDETGAVEVYVQPFLREGPRRRVSSGGGGQPRWRGDGRELFYLTRDGVMMSVTFSQAMEPSPALRLFDSGIHANPYLDRYVVTADGRRFLGLVPAPRPVAPQMAVLVNWQPKHP